MPAWPSIVPLEAAGFVSLPPDWQHVLGKLSSQSRIGLIDEPNACDARPANFQPKQIKKISCNLVFSFVS